MRTSVAAVAGGGPSVARSELVSTRAKHLRPESDARIAESRSELSREREAEAADFCSALDKDGIANTSLAEGHWGVTEPQARGLRKGARGLSLAHLVLGPVGVFRAVLVAACVRAMGKAEATQFFAACITCVAEVTKESGR